MSVTPKIAMSDDFLKAFAGVPRGAQQNVMRFVSKFRQNPQANGINYETIRNAADRNMRSVRINDGLRAIVLKPERGNVYCLLWVDQHDKAYTWATRHRVAIHPDVGSIQIYSVDEAADQGVDARAASAPAATPVIEPVKAAPATTAAAPPSALFAGLDDRQIRRLGVPDDKIGVVRAVQTEDDLDELERQIPDEAFETLYYFAAGDSFDELVKEREAKETVDTADFDTALERQNTRRHFVVLTEDSDLEALLAAPLELWRVFLHPSQRKLVERDWNGPVKVTGGAGTGKTVVAMHRARRLARQYAALPGQPIVFTTYTKTLAEDIHRNLRQLCTPEELDRIQVINLDKWALRILHGFGYKSKPLYEENKRRDFWSEAMSYLPASSHHSERFLRAEFERVVLMQGCESAEDYMRASRVGRGGQLPRRERKELWPVFAQYRALLRQHNYREPEEIFQDALSLLKEQGGTLGIRSMIVDEAQDVSASAFALIRAAVPQAENDLFVVGDAHQRIYRHRVVLSKVGIQVRGRSRRLRVNYRTTDEIRRWACAELEGCEIDDLDGDTESVKGYRSLTHGEIPDVKSFGTSLEESAEIERILDELKLDVPREQICIAARTNDDIDAYASALGQRNIKHLKLDSDVSDDQEKPGVRLATMHRIKGLEFSVVILAGYRGATQYAEKFARNEDVGVSDEAGLAERCLLHVTATRAKRHLFVLKREGQ